MSTRKPASLDGSLLARKGDAMPAVRLDSPLTQELGEPRPEATIVAFDKGAAETGRSSGAGAATAASMAMSPALRRGALIFVAAALIAALVFAALRWLPTTDDATRLDGPPGVATQAPSADVVGEPAVAPVLPPAATVESAVAAPVEALSGANEEQPAAPGGDVSDIPVPDAQSPTLPAALVAPVPSRKPDRKSPPARSSSYSLQLAALPTARDAQTEMARLQKRLGRTLAQRAIVIMRAARTDGQPVYRLRVAGYTSLADARGACKKIRQSKVGCLVVKR